MIDQAINTFSVVYDNTICEFTQYEFSPGIIFEFYEQQSTDHGEAKHSGQHQFRIDYTQIGRYECEFLDHTYSFRGENEVMLLATPTSEEWCLTSTHPIGGYRGCAFLILLDQLTEDDSILFHRFGICIDELVEELSASRRWSKLQSPRLVGLFHEIYDAHVLSNREMIYLKSLEILIFITQNYRGRLTDSVSSDFFPAKQVKKVKSIHEQVTGQLEVNLSFERLAREHEINYPVFNSIFKGIYGDSPYQYLKSLKMNLAAQKMLESDLSIMEIAASVGYTNPSKFSSAFASVMGASPRTFRKIQ